LNQIGEGSYGQVFKANWKGSGGGLHVAAKKLFVQKMKPEVITEFENEISIMR